MRQTSKSSLRFDTADWRRGGGSRERLRTLRDGRREDGSAQRRPATSDGPALQPAGAFFSNVGVRHAVGLIAQRILEGDESIAAFAKQLQQLADVIGLQLIGVQEKDLLRFVTDEVAGEFFIILKYSGRISEICVGDFVLDRDVSAFFRV